jgi:hypothetical protein
LFHDGTIVASLKRDYDELVSQPDWEDRVRKLMQEQHKNMMKSLLRGEHDEKIQQYFGSLEHPQGAEAQTPSPAPAPSAAPAPAGAQPASAPVDSSHEYSMGPRGAAPSASRKSAERRKKRRSTAGYHPQSDESSQPSVVSAPVVVITDLGSQEEKSDRSGPRQTRSRMSSPPARKPEQPATRPGADAAEASGPPLKPEESEAIPENIFGDVNVVDEKSLDEVILAYLAEDLPEE